MRKAGLGVGFFLASKKKIAAPSSNRTELLSIAAISDTRSREVSAINMVSLADNLLRWSYSFSPSALTKSNTTLGSHVKVYLGLGGFKL